MKCVVLVANWGGYPNNLQLNLGLRETISSLDNAGAKVWILRQIPKHRWNVPRVLGTIAWRGEDPDLIGLPLAAYSVQLLTQKRIFEGIIKDFPNVSILDPTEVFLRDGICRAAINGEALYWDEEHLTVVGAMLLRPLFEQIFEDLRQVAGR